MYQPQAETTADKCEPGVGSLPAEPRGLTLADLLALLAGISLALATMPPDVRGLFSPSAWRAERFPVSDDRLLLVFLLGMWVIGALGIAATCAVAVRVAIYRRMPAVGEWWTIVLLLSLPIVSIQVFNERLLTWLLVETGLTTRFELGLLDGPCGVPSAGPVLAALAVIAAGLALLGWLRRLPPVLKTAYLLALLWLFAALPARYWRLLESNNAVPVWNEVSWQEFRVIVFTIVLYGPMTFLAGLFAACYASDRYRRRPAAMRWTENVAPAMAILAVGFFGLWYAAGRVGYSPELALALAAGAVCHWPARWFWNRYWSSG